jgi:hypothetical protein
MKNRTLMIAFAAVLALLTGCSQSQAVTVTEPIQDESISSYVPYEVDKAQSSQKVDSFVDDNVLDVCYGTSNQLLMVKTDGVVLYDTASGTVLAEHDSESDSKMTWHRISSGFCAIGTENTGISCDFYDENLEKINEIALDSITSDPIFTVWAVSEDGTQIACSDLSEEKLSLYNCSTGETQLLLDYSEGTITDITSIYFDNSNHQLLLLCEIITDKSANSVTVWATIGLDGKNLTTHFLQNFTAGSNESTWFANGILFVSESNFSNTGTVCVIDINSGKETVYPLESKTERNRRQFLSRDGAYFATAEDNKQNNGFIVRIYRTSDGGLVAKENIVCSEDAQMHESPVITIMDENQTFFVKIGGFIEENMTTRENILVSSQVLQFSW